VTRRRRAARAIVLSPDGRVLLIRFVMRRSDGPFEFWATPGGEIEGGETDLEAARREVREEIGLDLDLEGPVHAATGTFEHEGEIVANADTFFLARCAVDAPRLHHATALEREALRELRWWSVEDIDAATAQIFPRDLAAAIRRLSP